MSERERYGLVGWLRVVEPLHGRNGWHLHAHVLLFLSDRPSRRGLQAWKASIFARWSDALTRAGLARPLNLAQDLHLVEGRSEPLAAYFTKHGDAPSLADAMAREVTGAAMKSTRIAHGRTPWAVLDDAAAGSASSLRLWREYERASKGRRQITWSRGLRDMLKLSPEVSEEDAAAEESAAAIDYLCQNVRARMAPPSPSRCPLPLDVSFLPLEMSSGLPLGLYSAELAGDSRAGHIEQVREFGLRVFTFRCELEIVTLARLA